jgi:uncharacterized protein
VVPVRISVTVTPNAKRPMVVRVDSANYKVKVDARASEGRANERLVELLAEHFDVPKSRVRIVSGALGRKKTVEIAPDPA